MRGVVCIGCFEPADLDGEDMEMGWRNIRLEPFPLKARVPPLLAALMGKALFGDPKARRTSPSRINSEPVVFLVEMLRKARKRISP